MIIHHTDKFSKYKVLCQKKLKYMDDFTFIPIKIVDPNNPSDHGFFQTPLLFSPYGIQQYTTNKPTIDLSFMNRSNDQTLETFYNHLLNIYHIIHKKFGSTYTVTPFLKTTIFNECMRCKITPNILIFDQQKQSIDTIPPFSYGSFMIYLHGLWISDSTIWFQWYVIQAKVIEPISLQEYLFIDDHESSAPTHPAPSDPAPDDKYSKMIKMGVPKEAVDRQKHLDTSSTSLKITSTSPPPPPPLPQPSPSSSSTLPMIKAEDLSKVTLKAVSKQLKEPIQNDTDMGYFEPPSLSQIQSMLKKLKPIP